MSLHRDPPTPAGGRYPEPPPFPAEAVPPPTAPGSPEAAAAAAPRPGPAENFPDRRRDAGRALPERGSMAVRTRPPPPRSRRGGGGRGAGRGVGGGEEGGGPPPPPVPPFRPRSRPERFGGRTRRPRPAPPGLSQWGSLETATPLRPAEPRRLRGRERGGAGSGGERPLGEGRDPRGLSPLWGPNPQMWGLWVGLCGD